MTDSNHLWFSSDTHFCHANILKYCNRPFSSVEEMNEKLIENWNSVITSEDEVWHLGDFALGRDEAKALNILQRLNGRKNLILGNHDKLARKYINFFQNSGYLSKDKYFYNIQEILVDDEEIGLKQGIVLCHFPLASWHHMSHGSWHLHGHTHGTLPSGDHQARLDVGVDCNDYYPISYEQVKAIMTKKVFKPIDHYGVK